MSLPPVIGRLAPSPTGFLHLGNARTFLIAWLHARQRGGQMILRIEDLDAPRVKPGYAEAQIDDLKWLGLVWDREPIFQSQRLEYYRAALQKLKEQELVYPCTCTRKDIEQSASAPHADNEPPLYPGRCAHRQAADADKLTVPYAWRFRFTEAPEFLDLFHGSVRLSAPAIGGDFVIWRGEIPSYQLAVVVDDAAQGVTEVIRGDDLIFSTPRQLGIFAALKQKPPRYGHVPLLLDSQGKRMAKRNDSTRLSNLRSAGVRSEDVIGRLAYSCGYLDTPIAISAQELLGICDASKLKIRPPLKV
ncbi:tRNA glutamyl-Q(34) synthetase GluQRS [Telmatocola sphagniphila]|uniref:Glutamyl-Q tRNA(Asp) synthetase n=1 Tax=Telmatocola sphagniphila TaxID=1123043 RepID=A0A8E6ETV4_9BACT|nr:tRNA glutamyl-Q(34) synthetase GluQRS [Telmatocola sphagniphila]QVL30595.1 tRNA glutamyl-Q(34) synthetase GluQRS [Telmatocola sphagniphila]